ncbi:neurofilament medium polypeptide-like [Homarus americanus]|uniref:neurofilament medium polypeptide-like n=1 Tax=Homarus americanus TaxID=6706 RepID=UPI001C48FA6B|nr:neurofilament medium polypeptide-like [Homarus americanus]
MEKKFVREFVLLKELKDLPSDSRPVNASESNIKPMTILLEITVDNQKVQMKMTEKDEGSMDETEEDRSMDEKKDEGSMDEKKDEGSMDEKKDEGSMDEKKDEGSMDEKKDEGSMDEKKDEGMDDDRVDGRDKGRRAFEGRERTKWTRPKKGRWTRKRTKGRWTRKKDEGSMDEKRTKGRWTRQKKDEVAWMDESKHVRRSGLDKT